MGKTLPRGNGDSARAAGNSVGGHMFGTVKHYWEINREERSFVALLGHALLSSPRARDHVVDTVNGRLPASAALDPTDLEVYVEAAPLRDFWRDLGPDPTPPGDAHERRHAVLRRILHEYAIGPDAVGSQGLFWTKQEPGVGKLWSPGRWPEKAINALPWSPGQRQDLVTVKQAWNSKPDLMLVSGKTCVLIEFKFESGFGTGQLRNARRITELLSLLCGDRYIQRPGLLTVTMSEPRLDGAYVDGSLRWQDLLKERWLSEVDDFTGRALGRLTT